MCNDKGNKTVKKGGFEGAREVAGASGMKAPKAGRMEEPKGMRRKGWTSVERAQEVGEVYAFPEFGRSYRSVPEGGEDAGNAVRSRLRSLVDFDAVEKANRASAKAAAEARKAKGAVRGGKGWTWISVSAKGGKE